MLGGGCISIGLSSQHGNPPPSSSRRVDRSLLKYFAPQYLYRHQHPLQQETQRLPSSQRCCTRGALQSARDDRRKSWARLGSHCDGVFRKGSMARPPQSGFRQREAAVGILQIRVPASGSSSIRLSSYVSSIQKWRIVSFLLL